MTDSPNMTVVEQIDQIANQELIPDYFENWTAGGDAETALRNRVSREDRTLLVVTGDKTVTEVTSTETLFESIEVVGFAFFGLYTSDEMKEYMKVPFEDVFDESDFPAGHARNVTIRSEHHGSVATIRLARQIKAKMMSLDTDVLVGSLRDRENVSTTHLVERMGAEPVAKFENYFGEYVTEGDAAEYEGTMVFYKLVNTDDDQRVGLES